MLLVRSIGGMATLVAWSCSAYQPAEAKAVFSPAEVVVRLHLKGDKKSLYALKEAPLKQGQGCVSWQRMPAGELGPNSISGLGIGHACRQDNLGRIRDRKPDRHHVLARNEACNP